MAKKAMVEDEIMVAGQHQYIKEDYMKRAF